MAMTRTAAVNSTNRDEAIEDEIRLLEARLRDGEGLILRARETGSDAELLERWEAGWLKLLHQYELLSDRLQRNSRTAPTVAGT